MNRVLLVDSFCNSIPTYTLIELEGDRVLAVVCVCVCCVLLQSSKITKNIKISLFLNKMDSTPETESKRPC